MPFFTTCPGAKIFSAIGCFAFTICCAGLAQAPQTQQPQVGIAPAQAAAPTQDSAPTLKITTREVLLDVIATDKNGMPIKGLKASDFAVSEEGEPQVIRRIEEHHPMPQADLEKLASAPQLPPNTFSNYTPVRNTNASIVLLLDAMDSPVGAQMVMRQQLINYLKHMQPGPPVAIFQLDTEMRLIQGFTSDPKVLLAAAESKRDVPSLARPTAAPRSYTGDAVYRRTLMETLRNGMRMLGSYLAGFPGRKNLIWFTGQVPMTVMGMGFGNPFRDGLTVHTTGDDVTDLTDVLTVSRVAVYPVDTRGLVVAPDMVTGRRGFISPSSPIYSHENMEDVAAQTGGKAYYNTNDFTRVITDVVNSGSSYYTIAYATTNTKWYGELRHIKVTVDQPGVQLQHKQGYYAYSLYNREQSGIQSIEKHRAEAAQPPATAQPSPQDQQPGSESQAASLGPAGQNAGEPANTDVLGATVHHQSGGFHAALALGAVPPTEIVFAAKIDPDAQVLKIDKDAPMPQNDYLQLEWKNKPFRNFTVSFDADVHHIRFTQTPDGLRHGSVQFVILVYTPDGEVVDALEQRAVLDLKPDTYHELLVAGLHVKQQVAVPVKGNFFLRMGIHDETGDQVGALEVPVDQISMNAPAAN